MKNPNHELADAIRDITASVQKAIDEGRRGGSSGRRESSRERQSHTHDTRRNQTPARGRSRSIDADDLVEVLLAIADRLDPPFEPPEQNRVAPGLACPECGEADADRLIWLDDEFVRCDACGTIYPPAG